MRDETRTLIELELKRAREKHPEQMTTHQRLSVLVEEVGEVARALNDEEPAVQLIHEMVQVAAVAIRMIEGG